MASVVAAADSVGGRLRYLRELGLPTLFGAIVLLGSATLLLFVNVSALRANLGSIEHSQQVLMRIADLENGILGDELSVRGYALTGDPRFLAYQKNERAKCDAARAALTRLGAAEPEHAAEYRQVMQYVGWHMDAFGKLTQGENVSLVVSRAIVDPVIRANMKRTRNGLAALRKQEVQDLGDRQRLMANQISRAFALAIGIIVAAFVLGGVGVCGAAAVARPWAGEKRKAMKALYKDV